MRLNQFGWLFGAISVASASGAVADETTSQDTQATNSLATVALMSDAEMDSVVAGIIIIDNLPSAIIIIDNLPIGEEDYLSIDASLSLEVDIGDGIQVGPIIR